MQHVHVPSVSSTNGPNGLMKSHWMNKKPFRVDWGVLLCISLTVMLFVVLSFDAVLAPPSLSQSPVNDTQSTDTVETMLDDPRSHPSWPISPHSHVVKSSSPEYENEDTRVVFPPPPPSPPSGPLASAQRSPAAHGAAAVGSDMATTLSPPAPQRQRGNEDEEGSTFAARSTSPPQQHQQQQHTTASSSSELAPRLTPVPVTETKTTMMEGPVETFRAENNQTERKVAVDVHRHAAWKQERARALEAAKQRTVDAPEYVDFPIPAGSGGAVAMVRLPRERRWEHLLPPENVPEYRRPWANFSTSCAAHGLVERPRDAATAAPPARRVFLINTYNNETDLLHMKLDEAYPVVDYIVLVEGARTFQYRPKPIHFSFERDTEFRRYHDKIIHHVYDFMPSQRKLRHKTNSLKWGQETRARKEGYRAIKHLVQPGDLIIAADVDEIVRREALQLLRDCDLPTVVSPPQPLSSTAASDGSPFPIVLTLTPHYFSFQWAGEGVWRAPFVVPFTLDYATKYNPFDRMGPRKMVRTTIHNAGWHCSWFLPIEGMLQKLAAFSHTEYNQAPYNESTFIEWNICENRTFWNNASLLVQRAVSSDRVDETQTAQFVDVTSVDVVNYVWRHAARLGWMLPGADMGLNCRSVLEAAAAAAAAAMNTGVETAATATVVDGEVGSQATPTP